MLLCLEITNTCNWSLVACTTVPVGIHLVLSCTTACVISFRLSLPGDSFQEGEQEEEEAGEHQEADIAYVAATREVAVRATGVGSAATTVLPDCRQEYKHYVEQKTTGRGWGDDKCLEMESADEFAAGLHPSLGHLAFIPAARQARQVGRTGWAMRPPRGGRSATDDSIAATAYSSAFQQLEEFRSLRRAKATEQLASPPQVRRRLPTLRMRCVETICSRWSLQVQLRYGLRGKTGQIPGVGMGLDLSNFTYT